MQLTAGPQLTATRGNVRKNKNRYSEWLTDAQRDRVTAGYKSPKKIVHLTNLWTEESKKNSSQLTNRY